MHKTKSEIIKIANNLFVENGYNNTTIKDICSASNISKTTFYYHFKAKEDIIVHHYDDIAIDITKNIATIMSMKTDWEKLIYYCETIVDNEIKFGPDFISQLLIINLNEYRESFEFIDFFKQLAIKLIERAQDSNEIGNKNDATTLFEAGSAIYFAHETMWCMKKGDYPWKVKMIKEFEVLFDVDLSLKLDEVLETNNNIE